MHNNHPTLAERIEADTFDMDSGFKGACRVFDVIERLEVSEGRHTTDPGVFHALNWKLMEDTPKSREARRWLMRNHGHPRGWASPLFVVSGPSGELREKVAEQISFQLECCKENNADNRGIVSLYPGTTKACAVLQCDADDVLPTLLADYCVRLGGRRLLRGKEIHDYVRQVAEDFDRWLSSQGMRTDYEAS